jgi:hypothetical protein
MSYRSQEDDINSMMHYLHIKEYEFSTSVFLNDAKNIAPRVRFYINIDGKKEIKHSVMPINIEERDYLDQLIENTYHRLVQLCREKAMNTLINKELLSIGFDWCCKKWSLEK